jgi:hypothetical protein
MKLTISLVLGLVSLVTYGQIPASTSPWPAVAFHAYQSPASKDAYKPSAADLASLPPGAQSSISATLGRDISSYQSRPQSSGVRAENAGHKLAADFTSTGVVIHNGSSRWRLSLRSYGYGNALKPIQSAIPQANSNRVEYERGSLTEWYVNGPLGLEQGFTIHRPPTRSTPSASSDQSLTVELTLSGDLFPSVNPDGTGLTLTDQQGKAKLRYTGLSATDAGGTSLRTWLEVRGEQLLIKVNDAGARYPVVIDPWMQRAKLTASDSTGLDGFGFSVSVSGNTIMVGAPDAVLSQGQGAVYAFVKPASGHITQIAKLTSSDGAGHLGWSVSLDGDTLVAGAPLTDIGNAQYQGAVYVFVKPASGWKDMTETAKLLASDGQSGDVLGWSVSLSGDTLVAGAPDATINSQYQGTIYVFARPPGGWKSTSKFTAKITTSDGGFGDGFGSSTALLGNTLVGGAGGHHSWRGAAYVFHKPANGWKSTSKFKARLTASDGAPNDGLGYSVSINRNTVVAGAIQNNNATSVGPGAAYLFVRPRSGWTAMTQTAKLTASDGVLGDELGYGVFIRGNTVVAGAPLANIGGGEFQGAAYVFVKPARGWRKKMSQTAKLAAGDRSHEFFGAAESALGNMLIVGADSYCSGCPSGAAYVFGISNADDSAHEIADIQ